MKASEVTKPSQDADVLVTDVGNVETCLLLVCSCSDILIILRLGLGTEEVYNDQLENLMCFYPIFFDAGCWSLG